jgi:hypothetical protein
MTIKYKNRTYKVFAVKSNGMDSGCVHAEWLGYSVLGQTKEQALELCHQMIEKDFVGTSEE